MLDLPSYSLRTMLGLTALIAAALTWMALVRTAKPEYVAWATIVAGTLGAVIVGVRRTGSIPYKFLVGIVFWFGAIYLSTFFYFVSMACQLWLQNSVDDLSLGLYGMGILFFAPLSALVFVYMLRAWTWSAHDWRIAHSNRANGPRT